MKHPDVHVAEWCNNRTHVMEIACPDIEIFTKIQKDLDELHWKGGKILQKNFLRGNLQLVLKTCRCRKIVPNISDLVESNSALSIPPEIFYGGWQEYRVVGFRESDYKKLFHQLTKLGLVRILGKRVFPERSIKDTFMISLPSVFSELTPKQVDSLMLALDHGYYQIPKKITAEQISTKRRIARTTYGEHLRKAESKIMQAIAPYVRMYSSGNLNLLNHPEIAAV